MEREPVLTLTKKDFTIRWFSGSGGGGQHRNKSSNCCEITHIESGISQNCTAHKSREQKHLMIYATNPSSNYGWPKRLERMLKS